MKKFFLFVAACVALVACNKNEADVNVPARQITIHATANVDNDGAANGPHRIAPNDITASSVSFHWQEGDKVWLISGDFSEMEIFTIDASTINGNQADFTGTALSDMSGYFVVYSDNDMSEETLMAFFNDGPITLNYHSGSQNWFFFDAGASGENFTLNCYKSIRMQLKGSCKLGKVTFLNKAPEAGQYSNATTTINFVHGEYDGLQLSETPVEVTLPLFSLGDQGFELRFFDTEGNEIDWKSKDGNSLYNKFYDYTLVNLGPIEVVAAPVVPEAVDLGLSVKWASFNVGAAAPERYGKYFAWGEIAPKTVYTWETYFDGEFPNFTKYRYAEGIDPESVVDIILDPEDDAAHVNLGGTWRMPTRTEQDELRDKCTWTWTTLNGVNGYSVEGTNGNSIFLPATGLMEGDYCTIDGLAGFYQSSTLYFGGPSGDAYIIGFDNDNVDRENYRGREGGYAVRAVCE